MMWNIKRISKKVNDTLFNYTEVQAKIKNATNDEAWGPTGQLMQEIAQHTFEYEHLADMMDMIWERTYSKTWRKIYKSLLLLSYLIQNGSENVIINVKENMKNLERLRTYNFIDKNTGKDYGNSVRLKAREIINLIIDEEKLENERKIAWTARKKYVGLSSANFSSQTNSRYNEKESSNRLAISRNKSPNDRDSNINAQRRFSPNYGISTNSNNADRNVESNHLNVDSSFSRASKWVPTSKIDLGAAALMLQGGSQPDPKPVAPVTSLVAKEPSNVELLADLIPYQEPRQDISANRNISNYDAFKNISSNSIFKGSENVGSVSKPIRKTAPFDDFTIPKDFRTNPFLNSDSIFTTSPPIKTPKNNPFSSFGIPKDYLNDGYNQPSTSKSSLSPRKTSLPLSKLPTNNTGNSHFQN